MELNGVPIEDTYAEAFSAIGARLLITAENERWAREAAASFTGLATSVIGSGCEAGAAGVASGTPAGRPGRPAGLADPRDGWGGRGGGPIRHGQRGRGRELFAPRGGTAGRTAGCRACRRGDASGPRSHPPLPGRGRSEREQSRIAV